MNINIATFRQLSVEELVSLAFEEGLDNAGNMRRSELVFELVRVKAGQGTGQQRPPTLIVYGVLEILADGFGFLRSELSSYAPGADDIYVSPSQIRRFNLRSGDLLEGKGRAPRDGERYIALLQIQKINGRSPEGERNRMHFDSMTVATRERSPSVADYEEDQRAALLVAVDELSAGRGSRILFLGEANHDNVNEVYTLVNSLEGFCVVFAPSLSAEQQLLYQQRFPPESTVQLFTTAPFDEPQRAKELLELALNRAKRMAERGESVHFVVSDLNAVVLDSVDRVGSVQPQLAEQSTAYSGRAFNGVAAASRYAQKILAQSRCFSDGGSLNVWAWAAFGRSGIEDTVLNRLQYQGEILCVLMAEDGNRPLTAAVRIAQTNNKTVLKG